MSIAPDAVGAMPGLGGPGMADPSGPPPGPTDPGSMAMLAAALQGGGGPDLGGPPSDTGDQGGTDLLSGMSTTDHIRAAIKHLMMAMTESTDDTESAGISKGMTALHGILSDKQKNAKTIQAAGG